MYTTFKLLTPETLAEVALEHPLERRGLLATMNSIGSRDRKTLYVAGHVTSASQLPSNVTRAIGGDATVNKMLSGAHASARAVLAARSLGNAPARTSAATTSAAMKAEIDGAPRVDASAYWNSLGREDSAEEKAVVVGPAPSRPLPSSPRDAAEERACRYWDSLAGTPHENEQKARDREERRAKAAAPWASASSEVRPEEELASRFWNSL